MCGIAGAVDMAGSRFVPETVLMAMADAIRHRVPDEDGYFQNGGVSMASRRLSIVGLLDGRQSICNEDGAVSVVFNGELFDYPEMKADLEAKGHRFRTHCDTELIPHLWEEYGDRMFDHLQGQFAIALWDGRQQRFILARDRFGICPLYWTRRGDWLLFGSEIKAILASGMVPVSPDRRGINHVFTFFAMPGPVTCFEGITSLMPGHFLDITSHPNVGQASLPAMQTAISGPRTVRDRTYWEIDFPDRGQEEDGAAIALTDRFEELMLSAVEKRLRADVPVVSYLSGGVDSSLVVAMASKVRGKPVPSFTIRIDDPRLNETQEAGIVVRHLGSRTRIINVGAGEVLNTYPRLVVPPKARSLTPPAPPSCFWPRTFTARGFKVALTGEGADEWLAGYPWYKVHKLLGYLDCIPGLPLSTSIRRLFLKMTGAAAVPREWIERTLETVGGPNPWLDIYGLVSIAKVRFFGPELRQVMIDNNPYADLGLNQTRLRRWHPLNRGLYLGARIHLPGLLLNAKGDRVAMHSSVETRYPFLDERVFSFLAGIHPRWKMRGLRDKHLLRLLAERYLPREIAWRRKAMFRAPFDSFHNANPPAFVDQLFSPESLRRTGYFDVQAVGYWRKAFKQMRARSTQRLSIEMGLAGVLSTQLWHHLYIDSSLADLPAMTLTRAKIRA